MNFLAFDTSTEELHLGVAHGERLWARASTGGAQASAQIIPLALQMLADAGLGLKDLDAIAMGRGPGSFTGLRTACAVAQGLAFGANVPVLPIDTLLAVAEEARAERAQAHVLAVIDARMGQYYAGAWAWQQSRWQCEMAPALLNPEELAFPTHWGTDGTNALVAGLGMDAVSDLLSRRDPPPFEVVAAAPTGRALLRLSTQAWASGAAVAAEMAMPIYLRDKVAQTTAEREALKKS